jgi:hypothetical protein
MDSIKWIVFKMNCTLCESEELRKINDEGDPRIYYQCAVCHLIFADPSFHLSQNAERSRYALHKNGIEHEGHVAFLNRVIEPCLPLLNDTMTGLDYGCGPVPTLSKILKQHGITCFDYDPLFGFDHPHREYDFVFATESFEHFYKPQKEFSLIDSLLKPGGYLGVMTEQYENTDRFKKWYYKRDLTHVSFYHRKSFIYLCETYGYEIKYADRNRVMVLQKVVNK